MTKGQTHPDVSLLLGLPMGLGILAGLLSMVMGMYSLIPAFFIAVFAMKWAFDMTTMQSLIAAGIWIGWRAGYPYIVRLFWSIFF